MDTLNVFKLVPNNILSMSSVFSVLGCFLQFLCELCKGLVMFFHHCVFNNEWKRCTNTFLTVHAPHPTFKWCAVLNYTKSNCKWAKMSNFKIQMSQKQFRTQKSIKSLLHSNDTGDWRCQSTSLNGKQLQEINMSSDTATTTKHSNWPGWLNTSQMLPTVPNTMNLISYGTGSQGLPNTSMTQG